MEGVDPLCQDMSVDVGEPGRASVSVIGEVDASNADRLRLAILDAASKHGAQVEVDLSGVTFIDSSGVRAIVDASVALDSSGSGLVLCHVPRHVLRIMEITDVGSSVEVRSTAPFERKFCPDPAELPPARAALRAWLHDVGVHGENTTSDVLVVTSELVTNGVFHDGGDLITLRADRQDRDVSIEVTTVDHLPGRHPTYRDVEDSLEGGRGLAIVHALSHAYSVVRRDNERVTVCRVTASD
jgi:anti-sigma B factor antagonist